MHIVERLLETAYQDTELLIERESMGDVLTVFHEVDFCLATPDEEQANTVCSFINDNQYGRAHVETGDGEYRVITIIDTPVTQNIICALSANMVSLSYIFSVDYSGWGATIEQGNE